MAVIKQIVQVPFANGIDTKTDPLQVPFGTLLALENGQFIQGGAINKRFGYDILGNRTQDNGTISKGQSLAVFNKQLLAFDGSAMFSYVQSTDSWNTVGACVSTIVSDIQIIRTNEATQSNPDNNIIQRADGSPGVQLTCWEDSRGGVWYSILDLGTQSFLLNEVQMHTGAYAPKVLCFNGVFYILYMLGNILNYQTVSPYNPLVITNPTELHTDGYSSSSFGCYDATVIGEKIYIIYMSTAPRIWIYSLDASGNISSKRGSFGLTLSGSRWCQNIVGDSLENVYMSYSDGYSVYSGVAPYNFDQTGVAFLDPVRLELGCGQVNTMSAIAATPFTTVAESSWQLFYEINNSNAQFEQVHIGGVANDTPIIPVVQRGVGLASKAFLHDGLVYINIIQSSPLQATYFTMDSEKNIIAKMNPEVSGSLITNGLLPEIYESVSGETYSYSNQVKGKILSQNNVLFSPLGVNVSTLDFNNVNSFLNAELSQNLFIVGGVLQSYDGASITEAGFHIYPEGITATISSTSGGSLSSGTYQYSAVYAWTDNFGQINYSATAVPVSITTSNTSSRVTVVVPTLKLTAKTGVTIILYRTLVNSPNFYRVGSFLGNPNNPNVDTISIVDGASDSSIQTNDLMYTTGGVLDNLAPPACSIVTTYNNRIFLAGLEDPNEIWYSQNKSDNSNENTIPTEFSDFLTITVNSLGGKITALQMMDQNLIIFKETNIYAMNGLGPDATGANSDYQDPYLITTDTGCNNVSSVVLTPAGIMFQSPKGIYLLDRNITPQYIGAPVEAYNSYVVSSATLDSSSNQVIFTTDGPTLVYNYFYQKWSTWTNILTFSQGGLIFDGVFTFIKPNGRVYTQDNESFTDGGTGISLSWTTANISLAAIQGYQMVYKIFILGQFKSPHTLNVSIAYDFNPAYTEFYTITPSGNETGYGDGLYGDGYFGGQYFPYEFRINPSQKKCSSIRIQVSDFQQSPDYGEGYSISNILLEVGVLPLANRLPGTGQNR